MLGLDKVVADEEKKLTIMTKIIKWILSCTENTEKDLLSPKCSIKSLIKLKYKICQISMAFCETSTSSEFSAQEMSEIKPMGQKLHRKLA